eukprot:scaffold644_cov353-Prasinococcus_capsulatus_cf.AAC.5
MDWSPLFSPLHALGGYAMALVKADGRDDAAPWSQCPSLPTPDALSTPDKASVPGTRPQPLEIGPRIAGRGSALNHVELQGGLTLLTLDISLLRHGGPYQTAGGLGRPLLHFRSTRVTDAYLIASSIRYSWVDETKGARVDKPRKPEPSGRGTPEPSTLHIETVSVMMTQKQTPRSTSSQGGGAAGWGAPTRAAPKKQIGGLADDLQGTPVEGRAEVERNW